MSSKRGLLQRSRHFRFWTGWGCHLFFQTRDFDIWGAGKNFSGPLSIGKSSRYSPYRGVSYPIRVETFCSKAMRIRSIAVGYKHSVFNTEESGAFTAGKNEDGRLSDGSNKDRYIAVPILLEQDSGRKRTDIRSVFAGFYCSYFVTYKGCVFSAGYNYHGQLGLGGSYSGKNVYIGRSIKGLRKPIVDIATGSSWAIFLAKQGELFGCGSNYGQFGISACGEAYVREPIEIDFFQKRGIRVEFCHTCFKTAYFITNKRQVFVSGQNCSGEFGMLYAVSSSLPVLSPKMSGFELFPSGNGTNFLVFKVNGKVYGTGECRYFGGLDEEQRAIAIREAKLLNKWRKQELKTYSPLELSFFRDKQVKQIALRDYGTFIICANGEIYSTGDGSAALMLGDDFMGDDDLRNLDFIQDFRLVGKFDLMVNRLNEDEEKMERIAFLCSRYSIFTTTFL